MTPETLKIGVGTLTLPSTETGQFVPKPQDCPLAPLFWQNASYESHGLLAFEHGFAPQWSDEQLLSLKDGLDCDDPMIIQGATTLPPNTMDRHFEKPTGCCVSYVGFRGGIECLVGIHDFFSDAATRADHLLGAYTASAFFLNWFDGQERSKMRGELSAKISEILAKRSNQRAQAHGSSQEETDVETQGHQGSHTL